MTIFRLTNSLVSDELITDDNAAAEIFSIRHSEIHEWLSKSGLDWRLRSRAYRNDAYDFDSYRLIFFIEFNDKADAAVFKMFWQDSDEIRWQ